MGILIVILIGVVLFGMAAGWCYNRNIRKKIERGELEAAPETVTVDSECCGQHEVCEKESLLAAVSKEVVYYDDEELDRFAGRRADNYDREETDEFEEILTTLRSEDVAGWVRSLQLRGIELPEALRDEVILIVGERRQ